MPLYKVSYRYVDGNNKVRKDSSNIDAKNMTTAKALAIKLEKKHFNKTIVVDSVKKV